MGKLISKCPRCNTMNEVNTSDFYMRGKAGTRVRCIKCSRSFCAELSKKDIETLFTDEDNPLVPIVKGDEDYVLESCLYK